MLHPDPALLLSFRRQRYLVITDLHIGFEERFAGQGIHLPSSATQLLADLRHLLQTYQPDHLIILGDLKYSVHRITRTEWLEVPRFLRQVREQIPITVVPGNHDGGLLHLLPEDVKCASASGLRLGSTGLLHGHALPGAQLRPTRRLLMGHLHPLFTRRGSTLSGQPLWLFLRTTRDAVFGPDGANPSLDIVVLPAFNRELAASGLLAYHERSISPILRRAQQHVITARVITLEGDVIGGADILPQLG